MVRINKRKKLKPVEFKEYHTEGIKEKQYYINTYKSFLCNPLYSPIQKILFLVLECHCGKNKVCWQSQNTLAQECNVSVPTVVKTLDDLLKINLIFYHERFTENNRKTSNAYYVLQKSKNSENFIMDSLDIYKGLNWKNKNNIEGQKNINPGK